MSIHRNYICIADLAEVVSVNPAAPMPGPPKKTDDKSFFDVSTYFISIKALILNSLLSIKVSLNVIYKHI